MTTTPDPDTPTSSPLYVVTWEDEYREASGIPLELRTVQEVGSLVHFTDARGLALIVRGDRLLSVIRDDLITDEEDDEGDGDGGPGVEPDDPDGPDEGPDGAQPVPTLRLVQLTESELDELDELEHPGELVDGPLAPTA